LKKFSDKRILKWIAVALVLLVAVALRVYGLQQLPPGLFGDEAVEGLDALDVLAGNLGIWFHAHLGREPIYVYLTAISYHWLGITAFATRLPALIAGLLTVPITFLFAREWASQLFPRERATRLAVLTTALIAISFWHIEMTRNAHRDTLLPLVEAVGYFFLWRAIRQHDWRLYACAGAVLGLAIYTYSPGRFVSVSVAVFIGVEWVVAKLANRSRDRIIALELDWRGLIVAAFLALVVIAPLGIYFARNPDQFSRRFNSVAVLDFESPLAALGSSVAGNLAQFVVPGMGYQSKHYNLPGKPVFDLLIAPWFLAGIVIALARFKLPSYRFLILWFVIMATPAFLTADMIPKGVRVLGVVPGVFVFPALAMDWLLESLVAKSRIAIRSLIPLCIVGSAVWTTYDYFVAWANLPDMPLAFDADLTEAADFIQRQPADQPIYISQEVYRPPTLMLLGEHVPTSRYVDQAGRFKEADARSVFIFSQTQANPVYVFIRDYAPSDEWLARIAPKAEKIVQGKYYNAFHLGAMASPQRALNASFNPLLRLGGVSRFDAEPRGIALYWQVTQLATDRTDIQATLSLLDANGVVVTQDKHQFGVPPLEWAVGDTLVEWYEFENLPADLSQFRIELVRGASKWGSPVLSMK
jgi:4-amino-4-deoxy-L-arabinose transferase-like glycosyltransferase